MYKTIILTNWKYFRSYCTVMICTFKKYFTIIEIVLHIIEIYPILAEINCTLKICISHIYNLVEKVSDLLAFDLVGGRPVHFLIPGPSNVCCMQELCITKVGSKLQEVAGTGWSFLQVSWWIPHPRDRSPQQQGQVGHLLESWQWEPPPSCPQLCGEWGCRCHSSQTGSWCRSQEVTGTWGQCHWGSHRRKHWDGHWESH